MDDRKVLTIEEVQQFLQGSGGVEFKPASGKERYAWVESVMRRFNYAVLSRSNKG